MLIAGRLLSCFGVSSRDRDAGAGRRNRAGRAPACQPLGARHCDRADQYCRICDGRGTGGRRYTGEHRYAGRS